MPVWNAARAAKIARLMLFSSNPVSAVPQLSSIPCWEKMKLFVLAALNQRVQ
jgi:hypothetical protein